jgi:hypothetical protein
VDVVDSALVESAGDFRSDIAGGGRTKPVWGSFDGRRCWPMMSVEAAGVGGRSG